MVKVNLGIDVGPWQPGAITPTTLCILATKTLTRFQLKAVLYSGSEDGCRLKFLDKEKKRKKDKVKMHVILFWPQCYSQGNSFADREACYHIPLVVLENCWLPDQP